MHIIWQRIKEECSKIGDYHTQEFNKPFESPLSKETLTLITRKQATLDVLELDIETFIVLGRRFMDKVGDMGYTSVGKSIQTEISSGPRRGLRLPTYDIADRILLVVIRMCRNEYIL